MATIRARLHSGMGDSFNDPVGQTTIQDVLAPFIVINFLMVDFTRENGATRFVPCTQRSRHKPPSLDEEPEWMRNSIICGKADYALIRDVRCRHAGTENTSDMVRPMTSMGYVAPWFRARHEGLLPRKLCDQLTPRGQELTKTLVASE